MIDFDKLVSNVSESCCAHFTRYLELKKFRQAVLHILLLCRGIAILFNV
jgi:hypothetical protein